MPKINSTFTSSTASHSALDSFGRDSGWTHISPALSNQQLPERNPQEVWDVFEAGVGTGSIFFLTHWICKCLFLWTMSLKLSLRECSKREKNKHSCDLSLVWPWKQNVRLMSKPACDIFLGCKFYPCLNITEKLWSNIQLKTLDS